MRKILLFGLLFFCSCSLNNDFSKRCIYNISNNSFNEKVVMNIKYNGDDLVEEAIIIKNYKVEDDVEIIKDIKESMAEYNNKYGGSGIKYVINKEFDDEYEIEYYIPVKLLDESILEDFKLQKNSVKLFRSLKKENIECEG